MFRENPDEVAERGLRGQSDVGHGVGVERRGEQPDEGHQEEDDDQHEHHVDRQRLYPRRAPRRDGEREIQGEHDDGDRGSISDGERLKGGVEREERDDLSGDAGSTVGQCLDHDEGPERRHRDGEQSERRDRPEARVGVVPETAPRVGAVHPSGFVDVRRDGLEGAEEDDHGEGRPSPDVGDDHRRHRERADPVDRAKTERAQEDVVQRAEEEVEHRHPQEPGDQRRVDPCEQHGAVRQGSEPPAPVLSVVDEERERQTKAELPDHRGAHDERDRVPDHGPEIRIGEEPRVVIETDEARICGVYSDEREIREARVERPDRRTDEKQSEEHGCRHDSGDVRGVPREHVQRIGRGPERRRSASAPWPLSLIAR